MGSRPTLLYRQNVNLQHDRDQSTLALGLKADLQNAPRLLVVKCGWHIACS